MFDMYIICALSGLLALQAIVFYVLRSGIRTNRISLQELQASDLVKDEDITKLESTVADLRTISMEDNLDLATPKKRLGN